jgi:hypothetical protein
VILLRPALAAALSTTALLASTPAWTAGNSPVFDAFASVCAVPAADFAAVKAAAEAKGWVSTTAKPDEASMPGVTVADALALASTVGTTGLTLSAWRGATNTGVKISDCTVHMQGAAYPDIKDAAGAWLAFQAQEDSPKRAIYRFTDAGGAHRSLTPPEFDTAAGAAGLQILTVSGDAKGTVLDLMMIKK